MGSGIHPNVVKHSQSFLLPAATKLGQGNIFTSVCQEFCPQGGGGCLPQCMLGYPPDQTPPPPRDQAPRSRHPPGPGTPPRTRHTPPEQTPPREADCSIRSTSGRYASYWNAFLFCNFFPNKIIVVFTN